MAPGGFRMCASGVVAEMLGVRHGPQDRVVLCLVDHVKYSRYFIVFLVLQYILGYQEFYFVVARQGEYMYVSVPTSEMVETLHGHRYKWKNKEVSFHCITYLNIRDYNKADEEGRDVVEMLY
jgi:hypothetical protein